jgi:cysteine desulfurase
MIYLDHAATTPDYTATYPSKIEWNNNPNAIHSLGVQAKLLLKEIEELIKKEINGKDGEIIWTGSGSQANNLAALSLPNLITSQIEHKSIRQHSQPFKVLPIDTNGYILIDTLQTELRLWSTIISLQLVNNVTGIIQPLEQVRYYKQDSLFHIDATQALKKINIDVENLQCDMLSLSAHKIYGPKGIGCLWVKNTCLNYKDINLPYQGTPSIELADRFALAIGVLNTQAYRTRLQEQECIFLNTLKKYITSNYYVVGLHANRIPGLFSIIFPSIDQDELLIRLDQLGVYVSLGSACSANELDPYVLKAMKLSEQDLTSSIRISLGDSLTISQVREAAMIIANTIKEMKNGS